MYYYYQTAEDKAWTPVDEKKLDQALKEVKGIKKATILAVSDLVDEDTKNNPNLSYRGPLYFDIDCKDDLQLAIDSGRTLCLKLIDTGVPAAGLEIYASGSKGIHVLVDQKYFSSGRPIKRLARIYKEIARELYVPGLDFQVYSAGRGNSWRQPNCKRDDGRYKVPLLYEELQELQERDYKALCSSPRPNVVHMLPTPVKSMELEALFDTCRKRVNAKETNHIPVLDKDLALVKEVVPACIQQAADYKDVLGDKNFNEVSMQLGIYVARSGVSPTIANGLISRLAENGRSSKYPTLRGKLQHVQGQVAYMENSPGYAFSCGSMRSLLVRPPCMGCPLENTASGAHHEAESGGIVEREHQFVIRGGQQDRMITNYSLEATDVFIDVPQDGGRPRRAGIKVDLWYKGEVHANFVMDETCWASRANFIRSVEGQAAKVPEVFYGSDSEVQKIKHYVMSREPDMGEIYQVWTCGVHMSVVSNTEVFTYVEPGMAINSNKVTGTHELAGRMIARPYFSECSIPTPGDEAVDEAMASLLKINQPKELAQIIGWFSACHLKAHLTANYSQFPLLGLWGNAGSGKSATAGLISWLNGTDYTVRDTGVNVSNITPYAVLEYCASTTTVPRIVEEFNQSKMRSNSYKQVGETLKAAWNGETILRGGIGKRSTAGRTGATVNEIPITSPLVVMSEQQIEAPALQERSLRVKLSKEKRKGRKGHLDTANRGRQLIRQVGKAMMAKSLKTTLNEVHRMMMDTENMLSTDIDDRPRYSNQVAMVGLRFLEKVLSENLQLPKATAACQALIEALEKHFVWLSEHAATANARSEVDAVMEALNLMTGVSMHHTNEQWIKDGVHVIRNRENENEIFLDLLLTHANYTKYAMQQMRPESRVLSGSFSNFETLLKDEDYYGGEFSLSDTDQGGRKYTKIFLDKLRNKGVNTSFFEEL